MRLRLVKGGSSYKSADAVVLGVDPGATSGVALAVKGVVLESGIATSWDDRRKWTTAFLKRAVDLELPYICALESWTQHGTWGFKQAMSCGEQAGRWIGDMEGAGALVVRVEPNEWRRAIFGGGPNRKKKVWKEMAKMYASGIRGTTSIREDEAEAVCIALWASKADRVAEELRKHVRRMKRAEMTGDD